MSNEALAQKPAEDAKRPTLKPLLAFSVVAGKYDGDDLNCKYSSDFATLDEAIEVYDTVSDFPWCYLQYKGRVLELYRKGLKIF